MNQYKDIKGFEGHYKACSNGTIVSIKDGKVKELSILNRGGGYKSVNLSINNKAKSYNIHRLIAETFIPNNENKPTVNHKDGNKENNSIDNLEWATYSENNKHAHDKKLNVPKKGVEHHFYGKRGKMCHNKGRKHNKPLGAAKIIINKENGIFYLSIKEAAESVGLKRTTLGAMLSGQNKNYTNFKYA